MISVLVTILTNGIQKIASAINGYSFGLANSNIEMKRFIKRMDINLKELTCISCDSEIKLENIGGIFKTNGQVIAYCGKPSCELEASHKF